MQTTTTPTGTDARRAAAEDAIAALGQALGSLRCAGSQRLVRLGISMTHFHVLTLLRHHDAMPMGRLADILDASMSSATGIIDRMEERGLVTRERVTSDRRIVLVRPTRTGLDLVDEAELVKSEMMRLALERMSLEQLERVGAAIGDLKSALDEVFAASPEATAGYQCTHVHGDGHHAAAPPVPAPAAPVATTQHQRSA
jgi:DNA-binding MarR family transcriptional regulator